MLSHPWLDCTGPGFDVRWDGFHSALSDAITLAGGASASSSLAYVSADDLTSTLPPDGVAALLPAQDRFVDFAGRHLSVTRGDLHPKDLEGYCHLGVIVLKYIAGRDHLSRCADGADGSVARHAAERAAGRGLLEQAWQQLTTALDGADVAFDFLESSRWGELLTARVLRMALAESETSLARPSWPHGSPTHLLRPRIVSSAALEAIAGRPCVKRFSSSNLTVVGISTHIALVEPVANLRDVLQRHNFRVFTRFLGVAHPSRLAACELMPEDSMCSRKGWASEVFDYLYTLVDMRSNYFNMLGFSQELWERVERLNRHHVAPVADLVVCAHPFLVCAMLRVFTDLHMLIYLTPTPLTFVPDGERTWVLGQLVTMAAHASTAILAASPVYALHVLYQTGLHVKYVRPCAVYIAQKHRWRGRDAKFRKWIYVWFGTSYLGALPVMAQLLLMQGRADGVAGLPDDRNFLIKEALPNPYQGWDFFEAVRCVVLLPWDLQLTAFPELYALGVPLVLPTAEYVASYALRVLAGVGELFWAVNPKFAGRLPGPWTDAFLAEPWVRDARGRNHAEGLASEAQFLYWYRASDFETFGHTLRFASLAELVHVAVATPLADLERISKAMRAEWANEQRATMSAYESAVVAWCILPIAAAT